MHRDKLHRDKWVLFQIIQSIRGKGRSSVRAKIASRAIHTLIHCRSWFMSDCSEHKIRTRHYGHADGTKHWCLTKRIGHWLRCKSWNNWFWYRCWVTKPKSDASGCIVYWSGRHIIPKYFNLKLLKLLRHSCTKHSQPDQFGKDHFTDGGTDNGGVAMKLWFRNLADWTILHTILGNPLGLLVKTNGPKEYP